MGELVELNIFIYILIGQQYFWLFQYMCNSVQIMVAAVI